MLLSSSSRKESLGSTPGGMPAGGVFFAPQLHTALLSALAFGRASHDALSRAGAALSVGYLPHFLLREVQHVIRFHFDRDRYPDRLCSVRVRNLVRENWQIRT